MNPPKYKEDATEIIQDVFDAMTFPVQIEDVSRTGNDHTLKVCDIYHAEPGRKVTIGGKEYKIKTYEGSELLVVTGPDNITVDKFNLYGVKFYHGTPIKQGEELKQEQQAKDKTPMGWLYEQFRQRFINDPASNTEREIDMRLFFLTQCSYEDWSTDQTYHNAIRPMQRFAENWLAQLEIPIDGVKRFDTDKMEYDLINYHRFGVFISNRGMDKSLWDDKLAGVELAIKLPVFRKEPCPECP